jgi:hypothetical protein
LGERRRCFLSVATRSPVLLLLTDLGFLPVVGSARGSVESGAGGSPWKTRNHMDDTDTTYNSPDTAYPFTPDSVEEARVEIRRMTNHIVDLSAKEEDLSHALSTIREQKRKLGLEVLKLGAWVKEQRETQNG